MKVIGIIAEYNPFHYGHYYQLQKIKEKYPDSLLIAVLSGNYTERGEVSLLDKWKKSEIVLQAGVDLVVELPFPFATQSADFFSYGAITILEYLKADFVIFGSESNSLFDLELIARTQLEHPDFDQLVNVYMKLGYNYPTALSNALYDITGKKINTPNDLLGVSYLKVILKYHYHIQAETIQRPNNYHNENLETMASATAIRKALREGKDVTHYVPDFVLPYLKDFHFQNDYFPFLKYKILTSKNLQDYHLVEEGIESRLKKEIKKATSYEDLCLRLSSKRYTYSRISRMLLYILCDITKEEMKDYREITYLRLLAFNQKGQQYLHDIKKDVHVPIISKIKKEKDKMLDLEIKTSYLYFLPQGETQNRAELEFKNCCKKEKFYD